VKPKKARTMGDTNAKRELASNLTSYSSDILCL
jgi:hypothetical protein